MIRTALSIGACLLVAANADIMEKGACVLDGAEAVNDMMDAGVYAWAASNRCSPAQLSKNTAVKCEMDIASAAESVNRMVMIMLRAVKTCNVADADECGMAAGKMTEHLEGIAAASGGVIQECRNPIQTSQNLVMRDSLRENGAGLPMSDPTFPQGEQTMCAVNLKDSMEQLFQVSVAISKAKKNCGHNGKCAYDAFEILAAFAGMGEYLMGTVGYCTTGTLPMKNFPLTCSEHIAELAKAVTGMVADADELGYQCKKYVPNMKALPGMTKDDVTTELKAPVTKGSTMIHVETQAGFEQGREIVIDPYTPIEEVNHIAGFGSIVLKEPLKYDHPNGAKIAMPIPPPYIAPPAPTKEEVIIVPEAQPPRLYADKKECEGESCDQKSDPQNHMNTVLAALLPVFAAIGFVGGSRMKRGQHMEIRDLELMEHDSEPQD